MPTVGWWKVEICILELIPCRCLATAGSLRFSFDQSLLWLISKYHTCFLWQINIMQHISRIFLCISPGEHTAHMHADHSTLHTYAHLQTHTYRCLKGSFLKQHLEQFCDGEGTVTCITHIMIHNYFVTMNKTCMT